MTRPILLTKEMRVRFSATAPEKVNRYGEPPIGTQGEYCGTLGRENTDNPIILFKLDNDNPYETRTLTHACDRKQLRKLPDNRATE